MHPLEMQDSNGVGGGADSRAMYEAPMTRVFPGACQVQDPLQDTSVAASLLTDNASQSFFRLSAGLGFGFGHLQSLAALW